MKQITVFMLGLFTLTVQAQNEMDIEKVSLNPHGSHCLPTIRLQNGLQMRNWGYGLTGDCNVCLKTATGTPAPCISRTRQHTASTVSAMAIRRNLA